MGTKEKIKNWLEAEYNSLHLEHVNGQLTHANFSKSKLFDFTADVLYNEKKHLVTILSENGNRDYIDSDTIIRIFIREVV